MRALIAILTIGLWAISVHAADLVVISSSASSLKAGSMLDGSKELTLAEGESLTLVTQQGKTLKLQGPYQGKPDAGTENSQDSLLDSLSRIVTDSEQAAALAVFRSAKKGSAMSLWCIWASSVAGAAICNGTSRKAKISCTKTHETPTQIATPTTV